MTSDLTPYIICAFPFFSSILHLKQSVTLYYHQTMSSYTSEYPSGNEFDPDYKTFFEKFYETSDSPSAHEEYSKQFTQDATLIMPTKKVQGREGTHILVRFFDYCAV